VVDIVDEDELKGDWEGLNGLNKKVWNEAVDGELDRLDRDGTWDMGGKVERRKQVGSKWVFKAK
jgi:hypothetical protein